MGTLIRLDDPSVWPVLPILLQDRTMKRNIIWATGSYDTLGEYYRDREQITAIALQRMGKDSIQPRIMKGQEEQQQRTRKHGEVQTPAWLCCRMNEYLDAAWFERENVFNVQDRQTWVPVEGKIVFPKHKHNSWRQYVDSRRLEITCGEAPFISSRYDAATGESIPIERRIGLLDRKLRIVSENTDNEVEWLKWAIRAVQSVYGYEYQGDNLLIARINVLMTFVEYLQAIWHRGPTEKELTTVANVISWNFWQMDGLTGTVPKGRLQAPEQEAKPITMEELGWFASIDGTTPSRRRQEQETMPPCRICNWRQAHNVAFVSLKKNRGRDVRNMRYDFAIGNPPYQDETLGDNKGFAPPVYHLFLDAAYEIADTVVMVHPARFLFNAGTTPKAWNSRMLADPHLKVALYEPDCTKMFSNTDIKGGIAVTYHDVSRDFGAIGTFTPYTELNSIIHRVISFAGFQKLSDIVVTSYAYHFTDNMHSDYPRAEACLSSGHKYDLKSNVIEKLPDIFHKDKPSDGQDYIVIIGRLGTERVYRYIRRSYVNDVVNLDKYKLFMSKANSSGAFGEAVTPPFIGAPGEGSTETFLSIGSFNTRTEAENALKYIKTKFARALLGVLKVTQDLTPGKWAYVPLQDFTPSSDIDWSEPISAIDEQLYCKYGLTDEEIAFIESHVKEMT